MYLEISGRQSNKTKRLVEHISKNYKHTNNYVIYSINSFMLSEIKRMLTAIANIETGRNFHFVTVAEGPDRVRGLKNYKFYFDEFDFYDRYKFMRVLNQFSLYVDGSYFCTSPYEERFFSDIVENIPDDPLIYLLNKNNRHYTFYDSAVKGKPQFKEDITINNKFIKYN